MTWRPRCLAIGMNRSIRRCALHRWMNTAASARCPRTTSAIVRVFASKRHYRDTRPAYFASTDLALPAAKALQGYGRRWSCEVDNLYLKLQAGLADFRVRPYEAVDKWCAVAQLAWAYVEWRFARERSAQIRSPADIIRRRGDEHVRAWLTGALQMVLDTGAIEPALRFLPAAA